MDPEFVRLVEAVENAARIAADADERFGIGVAFPLYDARDAERRALHRWHLDAVREAYQDGYEAGYEAGARDEFITRREHPTANPEE